jgi:hypothetical protein
MGDSSGFPWKSAILEGWNSFDLAMFCFCFFRIWEIMGNNGSLAG